MKIKKRTLLEDISVSIDEYTLRKIFGKASNIVKVAEYISEKKGITIEQVNPKRKVSSTEAIIFLEENWDYTLGCEIAKKLLQEKDATGNYINEKYNTMISAKDQYVDFLRQIEVGEKTSWSFSQGQYDSFLQSVLRRKDLTQKEKEDIIERAVRDNIRVVSYNIARNDFIEHSIIETMPGVLPTLKNIHGCDYYIDGIAYDQKVSKSLGKKFIENYKDKDEALADATQHPEKLIDSLFVNADIGRFKSTSIQNKVYFVFTDKLTLPINITLRLMEGKKSYINMSSTYDNNGTLENIDYKAILYII